MRALTPRLLALRDMPADMFTHYVETQPILKQRPEAENGFTSADLAALTELHTVAAAGRVWSRTQMVSQEFAQYFAVWRADAAVASPPAMVLARFTTTGTYALVIGSMIVATGEALAAVLPALLAGMRQRAAAHG